MTYIVKDTFVYSGDTVFNTLDEFLLHFWQGNPSDTMTWLSTLVDADNAAALQLLQTNIASQTWDADTKTYVRFIDFVSQTNYLACRLAVDSLPWTTDIKLIASTTHVLKMVKTTEIIE